MFVTVDGPETHSTALPVRSSNTQFLLNLVLSLRSAFEDAGSQPPTGLPARNPLHFLAHTVLPKQEYYSGMQQL